MRKRAWIAAGIALAIAAVMLAFEALQSAHDLRVARDELERLRRIVAALQVVERKQAEFEREVQLLDAKLALLEKMLPPALDTETFLAGLIDDARAAGVTVDVASYRDDRGRTVHRAVAVVNVSGPPSAIESLRARVLRRPRIVSWDGGPGQVVILRLYACPPASPAASVPVRRPNPQVWLWPLAARAAAIREQGAGLGAELARLRAIQDRVDAHEAARTRFEVLVSEVEKLKSGVTR